MRLSAESLMRAKQSAAERRNRMRDKQKGGGRYAIIAPELIIQAKQMDLLTYLRNYEPYELVKFSGNTYCTRTHDSLKISNGKWIWWSRGIGGRSALDYLIKVKGYSFLEAVETIIGHTAIQAPVYEKPQSKEENKPLLLPENVLPTE